MASAFELEILVDGRCMEQQLLPFATANAPDVVPAMEDDTWTDDEVYNKDVLANVLASSHGAALKTTMEHR